MQKLLSIALKDLKVAFRDRAGLILMLLAPMALIIGMGVISGRFSSSGSGAGISDIPIVIVNQDEGQLGQALVDVFYSPDLVDLIAPITTTVVETARQQVSDNTAAAAVIIPAGFTASIIPATALTATSFQTPTVISIELQTNPTRATSAEVVRSIILKFLARVETNQIGGQVTFEQLLTQKLVHPADIPALARDFGTRMDAGANASASTTITIEHMTNNDAPPAPFDVLALLAPGMALLFLMYTVTRGGAQLLAERDAGTLGRMLISPASSAQILGGKVAGIFLTALAQVVILIVVSTLLFNLRWGDWRGLILLLPAVAAAATGWGFLIASFVKTPQQAGSIGAAVMLLFGILGGSFGTNVPITGFLDTLSKITPNAWGIQAFTALGNGGNVTQIMPNLLALCAIAVVTFAVASLLFRRGNLIKK